VHNERTGPCGDVANTAVRRVIEETEARWAEAALAAAVFAVDPVGLGGVALRARPGPVRDHWLALLPQLRPQAKPMRRIPLHVTDGRLLGGLDLAATLAAGRPIAERGLLAEADGGIVLLAMAERVAPGVAGRLAAALDTREVALEREGFTARLPARFGLVALDEGEGGDERPPAVLLERLALHLDLEGLRAADCFDAMTTADDISRVSALLPEVAVDDDILGSLCAAGLALGVASLRATAFAVRAARIVAALHGRDRVTTEDASAAARLALAPRATRLPAVEEEERADTPPPQEGNDREEDRSARDPDAPLDDVVLAAAAAAIPAGLLAQLATAGASRARSSAGGRSGATQRAKLRGRPAGVRAGEPRQGARLSVVETLRAAAPWQPIRRRERQSDREEARIEVRRDDFRVRRYKQRAQTTTIFVVDASGSSALHRLAEAKGAVELLLAECYVRRDQVALIAFRGTDAELLLPPTRSLVRAKRSLAGLPGGGGTPLAAGIDAARALAEGVTRRGGFAAMVLLTDGRANVARDGTQGRPQAEADALASARALRVARVRSLLVDTSPRPQAAAEQLAREMGAVYLALPHADARALSRSVAAVLPSTRSTASS
jgi:magnesium chelatase subunit D